MYENLRGRVSRIISVGISAVVGAVEGLSPEGVMEEAIQEINEAAQEVNDERGRVIASNYMANKRLKEKQASHEELERKIAVAVAESRDELAEAGIARQLDIEAQIPVLKEAADDLAAKETELNSFIAALNAKKREMQEDLAKLRASRAKSGSPVGTENGGNAKSGADMSAVDKKVARAASTFERIMAQQTGLPGAESASLTDQAKLAELDKLNRENRIRERLMAVKAKQNI